MKVLHICNDYCGSKVHTNLYQRLGECGVNQTVYTYYRDEGLTGKNLFEQENTHFIYRPILKLYHRLLYHLKLRDVRNDLVQQVNANEYDLAHATTLFSDGPLALYLYKKYSLPYVVTVRNTDINEFLGFAPHTWCNGLAVLRHAKKIVFISKSLMAKFCKHIAIKPILNSIKEKFIVQPNGIDAYWLDNVCRGERNLSHNIIYVGRFDMNKNVLRLIKAVSLLRKNIPDIHLHLVGGDGCKHEKVLKMVEKNSSYLTYHGKVYDKNKLQSLYQKCAVFAMPSIFETFGLVYIEALSQGLPVVYTKNQGIDGMFDSSVGIGVHPKSVKNIKQALKTLLEHPLEYGSQSIDFTMFDWKKIADVYKRVYEDVVPEKQDGLFSLYLLMHD